MLTICIRGFKEWGNGHLSDWAQKDIEDIVGEDLDDILDESPETTLFHELTHAQKYFGASKVMGKTFTQFSF